MRDGTKLFTSYYVPRDTTRTYPILMQRTPYNIEPGGEDGVNAFVGLGAHFVEEGYILAFQDVRGKYMSEGEFVDVRPHDPDKTYGALWDTNYVAGNAIYLTSADAGNIVRTGNAGTEYRYTCGRRPEGTRAPTDPALP